MIQDDVLAQILLDWKAAATQVGDRSARLFPPVWRLREVLRDCLQALQVDARGLTFVWHSFRHGGASRAFLGGMQLSDILTRGRWKVESSGRHYIQSGRQMLLGLAMPGEVAQLASRVGQSGLASLLDPDLASILRG